MNGAGSDTSSVAVATNGSAAPDSDSLTPPATPPVQIPSYLQSLHRRLDHAESLFLHASFLSAYHEILALLDDLIILTTSQLSDDDDDAHDSDSAAAAADKHTTPLRTTDSTNGSSAKISQRTDIQHSLVTHTCVIQCICYAAMTLAIQCIYELNTHDKQLHTLIDKYYIHVNYIPYSIFLIYIQLYISLKQYDTVCTTIVSYIKARYHMDYSEMTTTSTHTHSNSDNSNGIDSGSNSANRYIRTYIQHNPNVPPLSSMEYETLIELLIFNGLIPLKLYGDAVKVVNSKRRSNGSAKAAVNTNAHGADSDGASSSNDYAISHSKRKQWLQYIRSIEEEEHRREAKQKRQGELLRATAERRKLHQAHQHDVDTASPAAADSASSSSTSLQRQTSQLSQRSAVAIGIRQQIVSTIQHTYRHTIHELLKLYESIRMYIKNNRRALLYALIVMLVVYRLYARSSLRLFGGVEKHPLLDMVQREIRNFMHLAFSNLLGQSVSQVFTQM